VCDGKSNVVLVNPLGEGTTSNCVKVDIRRAARTVQHEHRLVLQLSVGPETRMR
jgi:hypothetical protein